MYSCTLACMCRRISVYLEYEISRIQFHSLFIIYLKIRTYVFFNFRPGVDEQKERNKMQFVIPSAIFSRLSRGRMAVLGRVTGKAAQN